MPSVSKILFFLISSWNLVYSELTISINSPSAILMDAKTGVILYQKNAHEAHYPASITKVATALFALENAPLNFDKLIKADQDSIGAISSVDKKRSNYQKPSYWLEFGGTHMGIKRGELLSLKELFYGMMVISANDAANLIAKEVSGDIPVFVDQMNLYLEGIGARDTYFKNPHGLHHPEHHTTAYDMALITKEALKHPFFLEIASSVKHQRPKTNKQNPTMMIQSNRLLRKGNYYYAPAVLGKIGYHSDAKHNIVSVAENNGRTLIAVIMNTESGEDRYEDTKKMYEAAFSEEKKIVEYLKVDNIAVKRQLDKGNPSTLHTFVKQGFSLSFFPSEEPTVLVKVRWEKLDLPVEQGEQVGVIDFYVNEYVTPVTISLYASHAIDEGIWVGVVNYFKDYKWFLFSFFAGVILLFLLKKPNRSIRS
jgi:serine-type D-Ala-D-Ala carboxypeptidase (penicillin-binding protein 5/6)